MKNLSKSQRQLLALFAIFLLPPVSAYIAWKYVGEHGVTVTTNNGQFISPARPLQYDVLGEKAGATQRTVDLCCACASGL